MHSQNGPAHYRRGKGHTASTAMNNTGAAVITLALSVALVAAAFILLGVKVLFKKDGKFPSGHVHDNPELRKRLNRNR